MRIVLVTLLSLAILVVGFLVGWLVGGTGTDLGSVALLALPVMVVGFLVGWLVEWYLDNQSRAQREGLLAGGGSSEAANSQVSELTQTLKEVLSEREDEVDGLRIVLEKQETQYNQLRNDFDRYAETHPDDLTVVKGIGRIYQWKLRDAGYSTYAQLSKADAQHLREVLDIKAWQKTDPQSWIEQAQVLVHRD
jgi:predicted flap endonuclease-1-like 5' DNA nuclease